MNHEQKNINNSSIQKSDSLASPQLDSDIVLSVRNLSKKFCRNLRRSMAYGIMDLSKNLVGLKPDTTSLGKDEFWALDDVNFEVRKGESIGLIGVNGSGKTTLLRLLTGIFPPDQGEIMIKGRVGALIAVGAGFHPHMTGYENIYLNGSILGMSREELDAKLQTIVDFADIGDFLEAPVSTYSSGMRVRLGFAIAAQCDPDVLLIDEVLAVGDLVFKKKCFLRISELIERGTTIILVSHNIRQVQRFCQRVVFMDKGRIVADGGQQEVTKIYYDKLFEDESNGISKNKRVIDSSGELDVGIKVLNLRGEPSKKVSTNDGICFELSIEANEAVNSPIVGLGIFTTDFIRVCNLTYELDESDLEVNKCRELICKIPKLTLLPGTYVVNVAVKDKNNRIMFREEYATEFVIESGGSFGGNDGVVYLSSEWEFAVKN